MSKIASPLAPRATAADVVKTTDLSGKTAVITGGASGLGIETARALLGAGAAVILPVRDATKGEQVAAELRESTGNPQVQVTMLDLGSLSSVRAGAAHILELAPKIHILINTPESWRPQKATPPTALKRSSAPTTWDIFC